MDSKPSGLSQRARCPGSVWTLYTSSRGAFRTREISNGLGSGMSVSPFRLFRFLFLQLFQIGLEAVEAQLPFAAADLHPVHGFLHRGRLHPTRPPLRLPA